MGKTLAIIFSTIAFTLVGLAIAYMAPRDIPSMDEELLVALTFGPPVAGGLFGLVVGCIATAWGSWLTKR